MIPTFAKRLLLAALATTFLFCAVVLLRTTAFAAQRPANQPSSLEALDEGATPLTIDDVTHPPLAGAFRPISQMPVTNRPITRWYRFVAPRMNGIPLVLSLDEQASDADLYFPRRNGSYALARCGMRLPFDLRSYHSALPALALTPQMRMGELLYLRTYGTPNDVLIVPQAQFEDYDNAIERWAFCFSGFLFAIGISSLFLSLYLRERAFALQAALMAVAVLFTLVDSDLAWRYLWPSASIDHDFADNVAFVAYLFALLLFSRDFLSLDRTQRRLDIVLWGTFALNFLVTFAIGPLAPDSSVLTWLTPVINFLPFPLLLVAGILRWRGGFRQARFFTIGLAGMMCAFVAAGLLRQYWFARWGFDVGVAFDSLFFQFALADRLLSANRERDAAQTKELAAQNQLVQSQHDAIATLEQHNDAFTRFVPHEFLTLLDRKDIVAVQLGDHVERDMVVLFSDIRSFTALSEQLTPKESFDFVNAFLAQVGPVVREYGGFVDKYIGDAMMALFSGAADNAIDAAIAVQERVRRFNEGRARELLRPISVGVGLHRGRLMLGTIGEQKRLETTVIADAVNAASRLEQLTKTFGAQIVVSSAVVDAISSRQKYHLRPLGSISVRGMSRDLGVYEVCDADQPELLLAKMAASQEFERGVQAFAARDYALSLRLFENISTDNPDDLPAAYYRDRAAVQVTNLTDVPLAEPHSPQ